MEEIQLKTIEKIIPVPEHTNGVATTKITTDPKKLVEILTKSVDERTTMEIISSDSDSEG